MVRTSDTTTQLAAIDRAMRRVVETPWYACGSGHVMRLKDLQRQRRELKARQEAEGE